MYNEVEMAVRYISVIRVTEASKGVMSQSIELLEAPSNDAAFLYRSRGDVLFRGAYSPLWGRSLY